MESSECECFIYNDEIYYKINANSTSSANDKKIDAELKYMVEHSVWDDLELSNKLIIQAQKYLILRQIELIIKTHCE